MNMSSNSLPLPSHPPYTQRQCPYTNELCPHLHTAKVDAKGTHKNYDGIRLHCGNEVRQTSCSHATQRGSANDVLGSVHRRVSQASNRNPSITPTCSYSCCRQQLRSCAVTNLGEGAWPSQTCFLQPFPLVKHARSSTYRVSVAAPFPSMPPNMSTQEP